MKRHRLTVGELKALLRESLNGVIVEADEDEKSDEATQEEQPQQEVDRDVGDSIDAQVDKYLIGYESSAKASMNEGLDFRAMTYSFLNEESVDTGNGIDVHSFASDVARLIENYDSLLELKDTILKRATNFLKKVYDQTVVDQFTEVMDEQFELKDGESDIDRELDVDVPPGVGAGVPPGA